jgi:acyl-CoA reductase-like NAD-dependent aldehyde dehydrogenase
MLTTAKIAPALAAGNTVVIKPSEHTSASLLKLVPLFEEAGFPPGTVKLVTGYGADAGDALVHHPQGVKISFTGSTQTGSRIATACGSRFVPVTLELGGKSPNIVFNDADTDSAAMGIVAGIFAAAGQTCIAGSRVFLQRGVYDEVLDKVAARASHHQDRRPALRRHRTGPVAFAEQRDKIEEYVRLGRSEGGKVLHGGVRPELDLDGYFYPPPCLSTPTTACGSATRRSSGRPHGDVLRHRS